MKSFTLVIPLLLFTAAARGGDDWPQLQGDALRSGNAPGAAVTTPLGLVGAVPLTDGIYAAPVVAGGKVFVIDGSGVVCDNGIVCDATLWTGIPGVYAAGDVAHWINPMFAERQRMENWTAAAEQGAAAARNAIDPANAKPYSTVPYFWSDWYDARIQFVGSPNADEVVLVDGDVDANGRWVALYRKGDRLIGALTVNGQTEIMKYRGQIMKGGAWEDALAFAASRQR